MLSNTGTISLYLYLSFILIGFSSAILIFMLSKSKTLDFERLEKYIDYTKWLILSLAISTTSLIVSDLFRERDQDLKELQYFDKYVNDVKVEEKPLVRLQLARYFSLVAPSGEMKESWTSYYDTLRREYNVYLSAQIKKDKLDTITKPTPEQVRQINENERKIELFETPLSSDPINEEWLIIAGGDNNLEKATFELSKVSKINRNSSVIKKGNSYRTVLMGYLSKKEAENQLVDVKQKVNKLAYLVRKSSWCKSLEKGPECLICK